MLAATVDLIVLQGYARTSMEEIAARARVSRATIYRRWDSKRELVVDALMTRETDAPLPTEDLGSAREALLATAVGFIDATDSMLGKAFPAIIAEAVRDAEFGLLFRDLLIEPRHKTLEEIVRLGIASGEIREGIRPDLLVDTIMGALYYRLAVTQAPISPSIAEQIVATAFEGASAKLDKTTKDKSR